MAKVDNTALSAARQQLERSLREANKLYLIRPPYCCPPIPTNSPTRLGRLLATAGGGKRTTLWWIALFCQCLIGQWRTEANGSGV